MTSSPLKQVVILAGGKGTRLAPFTNDNPKPMVPFHGRPFLEYLIDLIRDQGIKDVLLLLGYKAEKIKNHFGNGDKFGVRIEYSVSTADDETNRRLQLARERLDEQFLLMYCDNYWPLNIAALAEHKLKLGAEAQIVAYKNEDRDTKDNLLIDEQGFVKKYDKSRSTPGASGVDIGFALLSKGHIEELSDENVSIEEALYPRLVARRGLAAFVTKHRYYSIGSNERLPSTEQFLRFQRSVFLDRDGVLNEKPPQATYVTSWDQWTWMPDALEAMRILNQSRIKVYIITNQAGIGRDLMSWDSLNEIHNRMTTEIRKAGGSIAGIYICPHKWDEGCDCRKPKPGLLFRAQGEHHLDLSKVTYIGDDDRDGEAAANAGCSFLQVGDKSSLLQAVQTLVNT
jgi:histidinol-phosphate phosphatase family protein